MKSRRNASVERKKSALQNQEQHRWEGGEGGGGAQKETSVKMAPAPGWSSSCGKEAVITHKSFVKSNL